MMYGSWYQLPLIHAPLLQQLVLGNSDQNEEEINAQLALIQLKPKVVYLSSRMSDASLLLLLNGIWSEIEELHRTYVLSNDVPGVTLAQALAGNANLRPPCPRMWCLTMRIRSSEAPDPVLVRRSVQTLRQIVKSRKRRGCISLTRVRCGWIEEGRNDNSGEEEEPTEDPEESPRAWIDVL
ncbi:hypothetical protein M408DRAFT_330241 [Serendipita vermifera MAFF 305830]|uniref:Uncharacterized protein n=1 Tax=Serendipita vermifera MAFF 305830 TaxID=933852 RepID=A0A0C3B6R6_SERVB|nr:hypothetical protein M408DRAFT_330241 [Serendipita vermifera MAFF 305830]